MDDLFFCDLKSYLTSAQPPRLLVAPPLPPWDGGSRLLVSLAYLGRGKYWRGEGASDASSRLWPGSPGDGACADGWPGGAPPADRDGGHAGDDGRAPDRAVGPHSRARREEGWPRIVHAPGGRVGRGTRRARRPAPGRPRRERPPPQHPRGRWRGNDPRGGFAGVRGRCRTGAPAAGGIPRGGRRG